MPRPWPPSTVPLPLGVTLRPNMPRLHCKGDALFGAAQLVDEQLQQLRELATIGRTHRCERIRYLLLRGRRRIARDRSSARSESHVDVTTIVDASRTSHQ